MPFPLRKFRQRRESMGLSRPELADRAGISHRLIEGLEQGRNVNPSLETLERLCVALGVSCDFFFTDDVPDDRTPPAKGRPKKPAN